MATSLYADSLAAFVPYILTLSFLVLAASLAVRYYRLRHIKGPFLASLTDLWAASRIWHGEYHHELIYKLHQQYGPVVRFGPNRVSFSQPAAIPTIYGTSQVFPKVSRAANDRWT